MARERVLLNTDVSSIKQLSGEQKAGVKLAHILLAIISIIICAYSVVFFVRGADVSERIFNTLDPSNVPDSLFSARVQQVNILLQEKKEYREYMSKNYQYTLGILLPILTSILGYIFGTKAKD